MKTKEVLKSEEQWRKEQGRKGEYDIILFKHSPYCPTSHHAREAYTKWFDALKSDALMVKSLTLDVVQNRALSRMIADETGIRHESPQVIWFCQDGSVKWHGSHFKITAEALDKVLA